MFSQDWHKQNKPYISPPTFSFTHCTVWPPAVRMPDGSRLPCHPFQKSMDSPMTKTRNSSTVNAPAHTLIDRWSVSVLCVCWVFIVRLSPNHLSDWEPRAVCSSKTAEAAHHKIVKAPSSTATVVGDRIALSHRSQIFKVPLTLSCQLNDLASRQ
jgi:hypothetical protein